MVFMVAVFEGVNRLKWWRLKTKIDAYVSNAERERERERESYI